MKKFLLYTLLFNLLFSIDKTDGQEVKRLTFPEVIKLSEEQSPNALMAKHRFRASYWQYRTFVAQYRPSLILTGTTPDYSNSYDKVWNSSTNGYDYQATNTISNLGSLALSQNIGFTGGTIYMNSDLTMFNDFENSSKKYITTPLSIGLTQPLFRYNALKWQKKTEPLKFEAAKKTFLANIEAVHQQAVMIFFSLAQAQINKQIAEMNFSNADTLFRIAQGRYQLGTIAEDELLQMQLSYLNSETARKQADMNLRDREIRLRSFLGFNDNIRIELIIPDEIPSIQVSTQEVFDLAMQNNPEMLNQQLTILTAQSSVAQAKAERGLNANLTASYGLRDQDPDMKLAYQDPNKQQRVRVGFTLPILDWGLGRGKYKMAQSSLELAQVQSNQAIVDFQQNLYLDVEQFNLQKSQVAIAAKSDTVAMKRYEVTKQRFLIGKIAVLDLNDADTRKDQNKRAYLQSLQDYWNYFYNIRSLTLFDFINRQPLETDYEKLIQ
ncbi:MAG: TolC family protein [Bacteroidales bacterium]|nr:TolC family protein [Bacteroidales bacterium]MBK8883246.1 TolC family protein [Bacteroidales bacterium]